MKDKQDYLDAKAKHDRQQRIKDGKPIFDPSQNPLLPTPNKPSLSNRRFNDRSRTITLKQAEELIEQLMEAYSDPGFQKLVHADAKAVTFEYGPFIKRLKKT